MVLPVELDRSRPIYCEDCIEIAREEKKGKGTLAAKPTVTITRPAGAAPAAGSAPVRVANDSPRVPSTASYSVTKTPAVDAQKHLPDEPSISLSSLMPKPVVESSTEIPPPVVSLAKDEPVKIPSSPVVVHPSPTPTPVTSPTRITPQPVSTTPHVLSPSSNPTTSHTTNSQLPNSTTLPSSSNSSEEEQKRKRKRKRKSRTGDLRTSAVASSSSIQSTQVREPSPVVKQTTSVPTATVVSSIPNPTTNTITNNQKPAPISPAPSPNIPSPPKTATGTLHVGQSIKFE